MRNKFFTIAICICAAVIMTVTFSADASAKAIYKFGGGPAGGTFQFMAGGISTYPPVKAIKEFRVLAGASGGSVENMRKVDSGAYSFGVVYSGHVWLGRNGQMKNDPTNYQFLRHAVNAINKVMTLGAGFSDITYELAALVVLTVVYFAIGVWIFNRTHMRAR